MPDDFCPEHGYEFMIHPKEWQAIPYCKKCDEERQAKNERERKAGERCDGKCQGGLTCTC